MIIYKIFERLSSRQDVRYSLLKTTNTCSTCIPHINNPLKKLDLKVSVLA